jgi:hypothetical protein
MYVVPASLRLYEILEDPLRLPGSPLVDDPVATLYLLSVELPADRIVPDEWLTLPAILKLLPNSRLQIPYVRVMQVLAGASDERTAVLETDDISRYFPH